MERHFDEKLHSLREKIIRMGCLVEEAMEKAVLAFIERDKGLAEQVKAEDNVIDRLEIQVDDEGHSLLVLEQPMAHDMRFIVMGLKISTDLERIGDHAVNIAEKVIYLDQNVRIDKDLQLSEMAKAAQAMLRKALEAFLKESASLAREVLASDDEVDDYHSALFGKLAAAVKEDPDFARPAMNLMMLSHNLERVADLASNIAEDVIYMKQGKEVRHHAEEQ